LNWSQICHITHSPELAAVLERHKGVFQNDLGAMKGMRARIHIRPEIKPVFRKPHPVPHRLKAAVERELERLQEEGVIEPVQFLEWAAPIVPIVKKMAKCGFVETTD